LYDSCDAKIFVLGDEKNSRHLKTLFRIAMNSAQTCQGLPYVFDSTHLPFWDGRNTNSRDAKKIESSTPNLSV